MSNYEDEEEALIAQAIAASLAEATAVRLQ